MLTLGGLHADLTLRLYDATCTRIATSDYRGDHYEEITRRLAAGSYFAQVSDAAATGSSFSLRFRIPRVGMTVLSHHVTETATTDGYRATVVGEVFNNTGHEYGVVQEEVTYYDQAGRVLGQVTTDCDGYAVAPGARSPFFVSIGLPRKYSTVAFTPILENLNAGQFPGLSLRDITGTQEGTAITYKGTIVNRNSHPAHDVWVAAVARDAWGQVLAENAGSFRNPILPYHTSPFALSLLWPAGATSTSFWVSTF